MAADIQKVLRRDLRHLTGSDQDERVEDHLEKAMANYEELHQVEKDHREMMDQRRRPELFWNQAPTVPLQPKLQPSAR